LCCAGAPIADRGVLVRACWVFGFNVEDVSFCDVLVAFIVVIGKLEPEVVPKQNSQGFGKYMQICLLTSTPNLNFKVEAA
jgi:hypothetical protein